MSLENIISKYLLNKADQLELDQLRVWQAEAHDNVQALKEIQQIFSLDMSDYKAYDTQNAWDKVAPHILEEKTKDFGAKVFQLKSWIISGVAIITLLAATTMVWQKYLTDSYTTNYLTIDTNQLANLPDNSIVSLDRGTTLDIISENFAQNRALSLTGRAYFEVVKDVQNPFTVMLPQGKITVLGTQFNISTSDNIEEIYVTEGHVRYEIEDRSFDLKAGDYIKVLDGDVIKVAMNDANYLSWKSGKLVLKDVNISTAVKSLATHYQSKITFLPDVALKDCKISTTLDHETLTEALEELSILLSIEYKAVGDKIVISDINC